MGKIITHKIKALAYIFGQLFMAPLFSFLQCDRHQLVGLILGNPNQITAILTESDSPCLTCLAASVGEKNIANNYSNEAMCGQADGATSAITFSARWMQRRKSGPDCLSAASFRAVRSASYGHLTLLRVAPSACLHMAGLNEPCSVGIADQIRMDLIF
jgi:hypothetical protein